MADRNDEGSPWNIAKWVFDQEIENIKENLYIRKKTYPGEGGISAEDVLSYGFEDVEEIPGARGSARLSLNPKDWTIKEFKKNLLDKPLGSITDWDEYRAMGKGAVWEALTTGRENMGGPDPDRYKLYDREARTGAVTPAVEDKYKGAAAAMTGYMQKSVTTGRNAGIHNLNLEAFKAWDSEIGGIDPANYQNLSPAEIEIISRAKQTLVGKNDALQAANTFAVAVNDLVENNDDKRSIRNLTAKRRIEIDGEQVTQENFKYKTRLDRSFQLTKNRLAALDDGGKKEAAGLISFMDRLEKQIYDSSGNLISDDKKIFGVLRKEKENLFRKTIEGGVVDKFSRNVVSDLQNNKDFKQLIGMDGVVSQSGKNLLNVMRVAHGDWDWEATNDFISDVFDGKLPRQIVWDRLVIPRIERYTPSFWIGRSVKAIGKKTGISNALGKYEDVWTKFQGTFIGGWATGGQYKIQLLKQKIVDLLEQVLTKGLAEVTGGLSLLAGKLLRPILNLLVNRTFAASAKAFEAIKKHDLSMLDETFEAAVKVMVGIALSCALILGTIIMVIVFLISAVLTAFDWSDTTKVATDISERIIYEPGLYAFGSYTAENCPTKDALDLTFPNNTSNGPARRAHDLVTELLRGFWCYWNHSPEYDSAADKADLFNELEFAFNSFPGSGIRNCAECLFWCTWLPYIAYDYSFDPGVSLLGAQNMYEHFKNTQVFIDPTQQRSASRVQPGDIVFFQTGGGTGWHAAMVYYTNADAIMTIHSNAPYKELALTVGLDGTVQSPIEFLKVMGFGRPK